MIKYSEKYILRIQLEILKKHKNVNISNIAPCITHCLLNFSNFWIWQDLKKKQIFSGVLFSHIPESESREHSEFIKWIKWRLNLSRSSKKKKYNSTFILETKSFKKKILRFLEITVYLPPCVVLSGMSWGLSTVCILPAWI